MLLVAASALVGTFMTESQLPQALATWIAKLTTNPYLVLLLLNVLFPILGMFLHSAAAIILTVPIVLPLIQQRSEEHTSELQSLMRISYAVFCLKKKHKI